MPNTGKPSRGCQACKDRKVKCDQALPSCLRCQRNGRQCPGYPTLTDIEFRNTLSNEVQKRPRMRSLVGSQESRRNSSIGAPMASDWHGQAVCMFLHDYVIQASPSDIQFGFLQSLPDLCSKEDNTSVVQEAVSAVALMSLAHRSSMDHLVVQARQRYGKALKLIALALNDPEELKKDSTLAAVLCASCYEVIDGEKPSWANDWTLHVDVLEYLLRIRRTEQIDSANSRYLSYNAHVYLTVRNISQRRRPSKESEFIFTDPRRDPYSREFGSLVCETCHLLASVEEALQQTTVGAVSATHFQNIIKFGLLLDARLRAWSERAAAVHKFAKIESPNTSSPGYAHPSQPNISTHLYSSPSMAYMWNQYRCMRIMLLQSILRCSLYQESSSSSGPLSLEVTGTNIPVEDEMQEMVNDIFASVPYLLDEVDQDGNLKTPQQKKAVGGMFLLWPLRLMLFQGPINPTQRDWIIERLVFIRNSLGIHKATEPL